MAAPTVPGPSSRASDEGAGWRSCAGFGVWKNDVPEGTRPTSWLRPSTLWQSRNDVIAKAIVDPTSAARARWVQLAGQRAAAAGTSPDFVISRPAGETFAVLVVGDPGEGDNSQYAVAHTLAGQARTADFAFICSDVIYPAGDLVDYGPKFHRPYRHFTAPIYAVPGNHDWYDGLHGFMHNFCRIDDSGYLPSFGRGPAAWIARKLWRKPQESDIETESERPEEDIPERPPPDPLQPAPYFAVDAGPVRFVGIDTGIRG
ncbi:MAG: metallophosphoesterase, partial [bacterium]